MLIWMLFMFYVDVDVDADVRMPKYVWCGHIVTTTIPTASFLLLYWNSVSHSIPRIHVISLPKRRRCRLEISIQCWQYRTREMGRRRRSWSREEKTIRYFGFCYLWFLLEHITKWFMVFVFVDQGNSNTISSIVGEIQCHRHRHRHDGCSKPYVSMFQW